MTDTEKVMLINRIILDFLEWNKFEDAKIGAIHVVNAITSVAEFEVGVKE